MKKNSKPSKKNGKKTEPVLLVEKKSFFDSMSAETIRGILGVFLFMCAIILFLSALGLAGIAGNSLYHGISYLVGVEYWLLPFIISCFAFSLFSNSYEQNKLRSIKTVGAFGFFVSALGIIAVTASEKAAGTLGVLFVKPLLLYLDTIATVVILAGILIISLLLIFDAELWIIIGKKILSLFGKNTVADDSLLESSEEMEEYEPSHEQEIPQVMKTSKQQHAHPNDTSLLLEDEDDLYEIADEIPLPEVKKKKQEKVFQLPSKYEEPPLTLLEGDRGKVNVGDTKAKSNIIRKTLQHFRIPVEMDEVVVGPSVTRYSLKPAAGVRLSKITTLQQNLELALAASPIRIEAPIPGKSLVGIEVPNTGKSIVGLSGLLSSPEFTEERVPLFVALGKDISGNAIYANIGKMPHLLVAGTTGSGKSVMIHSLIVSLLYRNGPERVRFIMVDPKLVELTLYNEIPHLLTPVITDAKKCILSLKWAEKEMNRRYKVLQQHKVQDIGGYHNDIIAPAYEKFEKAEKKGSDMSGIEMPEPMPHIVVVIDELADIMSAYPKELESAIVKLAQKSRAVGIHLILSTQRPEAKVVTGLIKANIPSRIALKVSTLIDSRVILDQGGAEKLLGYGDMLYLSGDMSKPRRIQSPFLTTPEVKDIVSYLIEHNHFIPDALLDLSENDGSVPVGGISLNLKGDEDGLDPLFNEVRDSLMREKKASTSFIQRHFKVGYGRAARIMDQLEDRGFISPSDGTNKPREVYSDQPSSSTDSSEQNGGDSQTYETE